MRSCEYRFPYEEPRRGQLEVAEAVREALDSGSALLLQAPTGFGKTVSLLYGALCSSAERILYLVRTRNEVAPVVRELRRIGGVVYSFLYSARRMCPVLTGAGEAPPPDEFWENCRLLRARGQCPYFEKLRSAEPSEVWAAVSAADSPFTAVRLLSSAGVCPFFALKMLAEEARVVVATYPYLFKRDIFEGVFAPHEYSDFAVIVDEAHSLVDAHTMLEEKLSSRDLLQAEAEIEKYAPEARSYAEALTRARRLIEAVKAGDRLTRAPREELLAVLGDPQEWLDLAEEIRAAKLREVVEASHAARIRVYTARVAAFAWLLSQDGVGLYVSSERGVRVAHAIPYDPEVVTGEPLNTCSGLVAASGTMPPLDFFRDVLGLKRRAKFYDVEMVHGPVYPRGSRFTVALLDVTTKFTERAPWMWDRYAAYLAAAVDATPRGVVLAVYPSYEVMREVAGRLSRLRVKQLLEDRSTTIDDVAAAVMGEGRALIHAVAGGKLVEGVELTTNGESLIKTVFIVGVPFPQPDDLLRDYLSRLAEKLARSITDAEEARRRAEYYVFVVTAVVRARQAIGRAQRSPRDRAAIVLGDRRFLAKRIRELMKLSIDAYASTPEELAEKLRSWWSSQQ